MAHTAAHRRRPLTVATPSPSPMNICELADNLGSPPYSLTISPTSHARKLATAARSSNLSPGMKEELYSGLPFTTLMQQMRIGSGGGGLSTPDMNMMATLINGR